MTVSENLSVIRLQGTDKYLWRAGHASSLRLDETDQVPAGAVVALPSAAIRLTSIAVDPAEARHLVRSLPFMLEDAVVEPVERLHFARKVLSSEQWAVAIVQRELMADWLGLLGADSTAPCVPECLLLPWQEGECCILIEHESALLRYGEAEGARVEANLLGPLLQSMPSRPFTIVIYGENRESDCELVPAELRDRVQWRQGSFGKAIMLTTPDAGLFDLRQGDFAPRLPLMRWWNTWQRVAVAAGIVLALQIGSDVIQYQRLKAENLALRSAIQASYRQANPRGAVVDVEKQLDRQIAEFAPSQSGTAFTPLLARVTQAVAADEGISISTLNFSASAREIRLDLMAGDYAAVEALRRRLDSDGLQATLETSSARDDQVRARLRVEQGV